MGTTVGYSHSDIDPSSIKTPSFSHDDIDPGSVSMPQSPSHSSILDTKVPGGTVGGYVRGALDALPYATAAAGALIAAPANIVAPGVASVGAGGLGYAGGKELADILKNRILGDQAQSANPVDETKRVGKNFAIGSAQEMGGQSLNKVAELAAGTKAGQYVLDKTGKVASKIASSLSGVPEKELTTYAKNAGEINSISKTHDNDPQEMADAFRQKTNADIQATKKDLNNQISQTLEQRSGQSVDAQPIINELNAAKGKINSKLRPEEIDQVDDIINKVKSVSKDGKISLQDAHDLKEVLQEQAKGAYSKNGQIFQVGAKAQQAARAGASATRSLLNEAAPEIASANGTLAELHDIQDVMNKNILAEGKPSASVYAAGSEANPANAKVLKRLGEITGTDILGDAQKLAAARTFGKPSLLPVDATGKSFTRMGVAGVGGYLLGGLPGAVAAEGLSSPAALKVAINTGRAVGPALKGIAEGAPSLMGRALLPSAKPQQSIAQPTQAPDLTPAQQNDVPTKGPKKWANDGFQNVIDHVSDDTLSQLLKDNKTSMLSDPKTNRLLVQASDLKPGSKAMDQIVSKIKTALAKDDE